MSNDSTITPPWSLRIDGRSLSFAICESQYLITLDASPETESWIRAFVNWKSERPAFVDGFFSENQIRIVVANRDFGAETTSQLATLLQLTDDRSRLQQIGEWSMGSSREEPPARLTDSQKQRLGELENELRQQITLEQTSTTSDGSADEGEPSSTIASAKEQVDDEAPAADESERSAIQPDKLNLYEPNDDNLHFAECLNLPPRSGVRRIALDVRCSDDSLNRVIDLLHIASVEVERLPETSGSRMILHPASSSQARGLITLLSTATDASCSWAYTD